MIGTVRCSASELRSTSILERARFQSECAFLNPRLCYLADAMKHSSCCLWLVWSRRRESNPYEPFIGIEFVGCSSDPKVVEPHTPIRYIFAEDFLPRILLATNFRPGPFYSPVFDLSSSVCPVLLISLYPSLLSAVVRILQSCAPS